MPAEKSAPKEKSQSQKERFVETAKKLEVDESGAEFERVFGKIVPPKTKKVIFGDKIPKP